MNELHHRSGATGLATMPAPRVTTDARERRRNEVMRVGIYLIFAPDRLVRVLDLPLAFRSSGLAEFWEDAFAPMSIAMLA